MARLPGGEGSEDEGEVVAGLMAIFRDGLLGTWHKDMGSVAANTYRGMRFSHVLIGWRKQIRSLYI